MIPLDELKESLKDLYNKIVIRTGRHYPHFNQILHLDDKNFLIQLNRMLKQESGGFIDIAKSAKSLDLTVEVEILSSKWRELFTTPNEYGFNTELLQKIKDRVYEHDDEGKFKDLYQ